MPACHEVKHLMDQTTDKARFKKWKTGYKPEQERKGGGHEPLDVLNSGGQEGLFAHIPDSEHASIGSIPNSV